MDARSTLRWILIVSAATVAAFGATTLVWGATTRARDLLIVPQIVQRDVQQQLIRVDRTEEGIRRGVGLQRRFGLLRERQRASALRLEPRHHLRPRQIAHPPRAKLRGNIRKLFCQRRSIWRE
jgi:hypothetical protein